MMERMGFEQALLHPKLTELQTENMLTGLGRGFKSHHPVHFFLCWNYGIELSLILVSVGQIQQHCK
jgi:hypothetical protein